MKQIIDAAKKLDGKVVCVGVKDREILSALSRNSNADIFTIDRIIYKSLFFKNKKAYLPDGKKINMKNIKKVFKKKSVDYVICDLNEIYEYFKYFLSNSVIINKKTLYIYGTSRFIDPKVLASRYHRYGATTETIIDGDEFIIIVDNSTSKTNWFKDKWYLMVDTFHNMGDMISTSLTG